MRSPIPARRKLAGWYVQQLRDHRMKIGAIRFLRLILFAIGMGKPGIGLWNGIVMSVSSKTPRRILALWFPRLPTDRLQRHEKPTIASPPLVAVAKVKSAMVLQAVDRQATSLGLSVGQPLANAHAMLPALEVVQTDEMADAQLLNRIADWCDRFTPLVAMDGSRRILLDVTGVSHLFGGEQEMLDKICSKLEIQGFAVRGAMAGTAAAARALARYRDGAVVAPGAEADAIKSLPVEALDIDDVIIHAFRRAGLKTVRQVATRKRSEITTRFGAATLSTLDEILGRNGKPISPRRQRASYWKQENFAEPIVTKEIIRTTIKSLAIALSEMMEKHDEGARQLEAIFFRADGAIRRIAIEMGMPTRDPVVVERMFCEKLDTLIDPLDPGFGFDLIRLCAVHVERTGSEVLDLNARTNEKAEISFLIDRLAARFGTNHILRFQPNDTHIPENSFSVVPAQSAVGIKTAWKKLRATHSAPRRPLRMFTRPEPINTVAITQLNWRRASRAIIQHVGPERIAMEWWRHEKIQPERDYFRMEDEEGRRYWLYRNKATEQWFLHGLFA